MYQIQITRKKKEKMVEHAEKALKHLGKLMQCVEEMGEDEMGERYGGRYGNRMGERMGERDDWEEDDEDYPMNERRRRGSNGRYM